MSHARLRLAGMKATEFWFWKMRDDWGRVRRSVCRFTEAEALKRDPHAERVEGTCEVRMCPETVEELARAAPKTPPSGMPRHQQNPTSAAYAWPYERDQTAGGRSPLGRGGGRPT